MTPIRVALNCVWKGGGLGTLSPEKCTDAHNFLDHFRGVQDEVSVGGSWDLCFPPFLISIKSTPRERAPSLEV